MATPYFYDNLKKKWERMLTETDFKIIETQPISNLFSFEEEEIPLNPSTFSYSNLTAETTGSNLYVNLIISTQGRSSASIFKATSDGMYHLRVWNEGRENFVIEKKRGHASSEIKAFEEANYLISLNKDEEIIITIRDNYPRNFSINGIRLYKVNKITTDIETNKAEKIPRIWTNVLLQKYGYQDIELERDFFLRTDGLFGPVSNVDKTKNTLQFTAHVDPRKSADKSHTHIVSEVTGLQDAINNIGKIKIGNEYLDAYVVEAGQANRYPNGIVFEKY